MERINQAPEIILDTDNINADLIELLATCWVVVVEQIDNRIRLHLHTK